MLMIMLIWNYGPRLIMGLDLLQRAVTFGAGREGSGIQDSTFKPSRNSGFKFQMVRFGCKFQIGWDTDTGDKFHGHSIIFFGFSLDLNFRSLSEIKT